MKAIYHISFERQYKIDELLLVITFWIMNGCSRICECFSVLVLGPPSLHLLGVSLRWRTRFKWTGCSPRTNEWAMVLHQLWGKTPIINIKQLMNLQRTCPLPKQRQEDRTSCISEKMFRFLFVFWGSCHFLRSEKICWKHWMLLHSEYLKTLLDPLMRPREK